MQWMHGCSFCNWFETYMKFPLTQCRIQASAGRFPAGFRAIGGKDRQAARSGTKRETRGRCSPFVLVKQKSNKAGMAEHRMRIIGIDPGLRTLGWGVIDSAGSRLSHVASGICQPEGSDLALRLLSLHRLLSAVLAEFDPTAAAVEQTFVNKDGAGTLKLGQARGIALLVPAQAGLPVSEYAPNTVKKTVVGVGHADKRQVAHMVRLQLPGADPGSPDAADALAIAICHAHHRGRDLSAALREIAT
jgi:crossover junction endodeoxyribonuclease RuvC